MNKTVLVVDDDPTQRRLSQAVLEREGFRVVHADSGRAALDQLASGAPADVVLLDLNMPGLDGTETLRRIKMNPALARIPVVVFSSSRASQEVDRAYSLRGKCLFQQAAFLGELRPKSRHPGPALAGLRRVAHSRRSASSRKYRIHRRSFRFLGSYNRTSSSPGFFRPVCD